MRLPVETGRPMRSQNSLNGTARGAVFAAPTAALMAAPSGSAIESWCRQRARRALSRPSPAAAKTSSQQVAFTDKAVCLCSLRLLATEHNPKT
jgi:hypothetical protein